MTTFNTDQISERLDALNAAQYKMERVLAELRASMLQEIWPVDLELDASGLPSGTMEDVLVVHINKPTTRERLCQLLNEYCQESEYAGVVLVMYQQINLPAAIHGKPVRTLYRTA